MLGLRAGFTTFTGCLECSFVFNYLKATDTFSILLAFINWASSKYDKVQFPQIQSQWQDDGSRIVHIWAMIGGAVVYSFPVDQWYLFFCYYSQYTPTQHSYRYVFSVAMFEIQIHQVIMLLELRNMHFSIYSVCYSRLEGWHECCRLPKRKCYNCRFQRRAAFTEILWKGRLTQIIKRYFPITVPLVVSVLSAEVEKYLRHPLHYNGGGPFCETIKKTCCYTIIS